jgi:plastocyanin
MIRKLHWIFLMSLAVAGCTAHSHMNAPAARNVEVRIDNFTFTPANVTIAPGTTVTWINHDDVPHTATSTTRAFASAALDTDEKFSFTFSKAGTFPYYCAVHPHMTGQITVK